MVKTVGDLQNRQPQESGYTRQAIALAALIFSVAWVLGFVLLYYLFPLYILVSLLYLSFLVGFRMYKGFRRRPKNKMEVLKRLKQGRITPAQAIEELKRCRS